MQAYYKAKRYLALIHHPVVNRNGETITSAITNLDLHDIARSAATYGVSALFVVTPLEDQQTLAGQLIGHWTTGAGAEYNRNRQTALQLVRTCAGLDDAIEQIQRENGSSPLVVATSAKPDGWTADFDSIRGCMQTERPLLLLFGTAWGMAPELMHQADYILEPVRGTQPYNHLSVRSAAAIILDRLHLAATDKKTENNRVF